MGEIKDKVHLSPAEAEIGAELGKIEKMLFVTKQIFAECLPAGSSCKKLRLPSLPCSQLQSL